MDDENSELTNHIEYEEEEEDFLAELNRDNYIPKLSKAMELKQQKAQEKEQKRLYQEQEKAAKIFARESKRQEAALFKESKKQKKTNNDNDTDSLFGEKGTEILGDQRMLLK